MTATRPSLLRPLLLLALALPAGTARAQLAPTPSPPEYVRETWTVADGLPINSISSLLQSRDGYLWLGTNDGVVRFDGVRFTVFNVGNTPALPSNRVIALHEDRAGAIWIVTEQQHLVRYLHGRFTHVDAGRGLRAGALRLSEMADGTLVLLTTRGAGIVRDARFTPILDSVTIEGGYGGAVMRRDGSLWIAGRQRLWRVANGRVEDITPDVLRGHQIMRLALDPAGRLWMSAGGTWIEDGGLREVRRSDGSSVLAVGRFVFDTRNQSAWLISAFGVDVARDTIARSVSRFENDGQAFVLSLVLDGAGTAWYANGTELLHNGRRVAVLGGAAGDNLAPGSVVALSIDREGSVWVGTRASGLHRLKPSIFTVVGVPEGLGSGNVYPVYEDPWGSVWVGALSAGVNRIDDGGRRVANFSSPAKDDDGFMLYPPNPRDFLSDRPDRLWVAALDGMRSCTLPAFRCTKVAAPVRGNELGVHALHADAQGRVWAGVDDGVLRLDDGEWRRVAGWPLGTIQVRAFVNTPDGATWIATGGGGIVRHSGGRFTTVSMVDGLPSDVLRALYVDPDGWLWIGTEGRGLARFDPRAWSDTTRSRRIVRIGTEHGLYDGAIHRILADDAGRLWMNTNRGIFWVPLAELVAVAEGRAREVHSTAYTDRDGLRNREGNGGVGSAGTRTRDGRLWFPTQDGVAIVDPRSVTARRVTPSVVIERVVAGDSAQVPADGPVLVGVRNRDLTIEYTALSLLEPKNLRFRYRLEPYDADWVDAGNRRVAYYTKVPPGTYRFRVQAASPDAEFGAQEGVLSVALAFHLWERPLVRLAAVVLLLVVAVRGVVRWSQRARRRAAELELVVAERTSALRDREQQLERQNVQLAELDRAKSRFFANVSHELRTPLTLTIGPLEGVVDRLHGTDAGVGRAVDMALRNSRWLLGLVNQILDVAKLEAGHVHLRRRRLDLAPFVRGIADGFVPTAEAKGVLLAVVAPDTLRGAFDADALEKIVSNLLSNAVKFTPGGGRITISLRESDTGVELRVSDTGPGIPAEHLPHVFERFYQVDESLTRSEVGTGIGLALVQELVGLHGGTITVSSGDLAPGAVFTVTLPLGEPDVDVDDGTGALAVVIDGSASVGVTADAAAGAQPPGSADERGRDVPTLLIVDDSADLRAYVRDRFAREFRVLEAANGSEGIEVARHEVPDIVVSDLMMPEMDGHALVRALRASPETDFLPVILLTAHTAMEQRIVGLQGGADDYLTKPFDMRELAARVDNLIAQRRRLRERFVATPPSPAHVARDVVAVVASSPRPSGPVVEPKLSQTDRAFMAKVEAAIQQHLADPEFGVGELSREVAQDRTHLFRRARQLFGESPSDLLRRARLTRGAALLRETDERVADIAYAVGFNSVSYFSQCFLAAYGVTPSAYRDAQATPPT